MTCRTLLGALTLLVATAFATNAIAQDHSKPNILLIVADDLGYSDLGSFGGEIDTPKLDALAASGIRFTSFYTSPTCSPTRSMLLTGTDNHVAGLGNMGEWLGPSQKGQSGYEGHLNDNVVTVATLLKEAGYHTFMAGKWHLGESLNRWPASRGFSRDLSMLDGAGGHWGDMQGLNPRHPRVHFTRNGETIGKLPEDYFSSRNFTDFIISSVEEHRGDNRPFFAYLAFQAPHGPLAVPDKWRDKHKGRYDTGYDEIRKRRLARQKRYGIVPQHAVGFPRPPSTPAWVDLNSEQQRQLARKMELYAAMVENMDHQIGRLLEYLSQIGELQNTTIFFLSDNGAAGEDVAELIAQLSPESEEWLERTFDNSFENWGRPGSLVDYGPSWAQIGMTPFRQFKGVLAEGGIRAPLIVAGHGADHEGSVNHSLLHVMDIVPTVLELAGVEHPAGKKDIEFAPVQGVSLLPLLAGDANSIRTETDWLGWELFGNRAIRQGDWKLLYLLEKAGGTGDWQLFNLHKDPGELQDLSKEYPEKRKTMTELWEQYAQTNGVIISDAGPFAEP